MVVPTIALYASPPSSVCSGPQINAHTVYDFDVNGRSSSSASASASASKPSVGGLSCLFSSPTVKSTSYSGGSEELGSIWPDKNEDLVLSSSFRYSGLSSSVKRDTQAHQSPVSVLHGPSSSSIGPSSSLRSQSMRIMSGDFRISGDISLLHGPSSSSMGPGSSSRSPSMRILSGDLRISGDMSSIRSGSGGLFNGFVRHALGSYVDCGYDSYQVKGFDPSSPGLVVDDLTFNMEDPFTELAMPPYAKDLLSDVQSRHLVFRDDFVIKAFVEAERAHRGQMRASGHPYLQHCVETAVSLAMIGANSTVVAAGLLHDTFDDSSVTYDHVFRMFGAEVADLVEGVSKLSHLSKLARENNTASKTVEADRMHTMFLAMADARAVLIKLADRLHNMKTLEALPLAKQQRFAKESLEIFAPLANRLGISTWKEQLENLCFKHLNPDQHQELASKFLKSFDEVMITSAVEELEQALKDEGINYHSLCGRHKSLYSIYSKMLKKKLNIDEIHDIHGLRLIVETEEECYKALRVVHQLWHEVPGRFKDYIVRPKFNGYQSLHTVVNGEDMVPFEVQIRTKEMHLQAEYGFAAHWRYKEGDCKHSSFVLQMVEWARWVVTWQCEAMSKDKSSVSFTDIVKLPCTFPTHSPDCPFSCKPHCGSDGPVYVIVIENDKMSVQEFPSNSSVMDLLQRTGRGTSRWGSYGFPVKEELRPRLNHEPVSDPTSKLKMGDVVELTPAIPDKSLTEYREEIQRMYDRGRGFAVPSGSMASFRS